MESGNSAGVPDIVARARGCVLGLMLGDALGAAFEGMGPEEARQLCIKEFKENFVEDFIPAVPMGTFVPAGEPATYREAKNVQDVNFVPTGPPQNEAVAQQCARKGMYTDDTNSCLAVAAAIVKEQRVDVASIANYCAYYVFNNPYFRGCPPTAKDVMLKIQQGADPNATGLPPYFPFPGGSFANGGAMRISPLAIPFRNANTDQIEAAVQRACWATHRHQEAIDFAVMQALAVRYCLHNTVESFNGDALLLDLASRCRSSDMQNIVQATRARLASFTGEAQLEREFAVELRALKAIVDGVQRPGSGMRFQIASIHMAPCVLWSACRYYRNPVHAIQFAVAVGGDTDTTAEMVGAIVGALHGESWCGRWASGLENGSWGRDYALGLAEHLARLDLRQ